MGPFQKVRGINQGLGVGVGVGLQQWSQWKQLRLPVDYYLSLADCQLVICPCSVNCSVGYGWLSVSFMSWAPETVTFKHFCLFSLCESLFVSLWWTPEKNNVKGGRGHLSLWFQSLVGSLHRFWICDRQRASRHKGVAEHKRSLHGSQGWGWGSRLPIFVHPGSQPTDGAVYIQPQDSRHVSVLSEVPFTDTLKKCFTNLSGAST